MNNERNRSHVLIVEDETWIRELWAAELQEDPAGYSVIAMGHPHAALPILTSGNVCAAIIDIGLPDMNGEELVGVARRSDPRLPIVVVTGFDAARYRHLCNEHVRVLQKPFRTRWLLTNLAALLNREPQEESPAARPDALSPSIELKYAC